jgi:hypothetical protein
VDGLSTRERVAPVARKGHPVGDTARVMEETI